MNGRRTNIARRIGTGALPLLVLIQLVFTGFGSFVNYARAQGVEVTDKSLQADADAYFANDGVAQEKQFFQPIKAALEKALSGTFFKNVVGGLANSISRQTALWVVSGAGGKPQFITNFGDYIKGYADAVVGDIVSSVVQDVTGINLCTFDPRIALDLSLAIPFFPAGEYGFAGYKTDCSWSDLQDHWKDIGQGKFFQAKIGLEAGSFPEATQNLQNQIKFEDTLRTFPNKKWAQDYFQKKSWPLEGGDLGLGGILKSPKPLVQSKLEAFSIEADNVRKKISDAIDEIQLKQSTKPVTKEELRAKRDELLDTYVKKDQEALKTQVLDPLIKCKGKTWADYLGSCLVAADLVGMKPDQTAIPSEQVEPALTGGTTTTKPQEEFAQLTSEKIGLATQYAQTMQTVFSALEQSVNDTMREEYLSSNEPFSVAKAKSVFNPSANQFNVQRDISTKILNEGFNAYLNRNVQAVANNGWKAVTETISDVVKTPATLISDFTSSRVASPSFAQKTLEDVGDITANAAGVFMTELWNGFMAKLLLSLNNSKSTAQYDMNTALTDCQKEVETGRIDISQYCQAILEMQTGGNIQDAIAKAQSELASGQLAASQVGKRILELVGADNVNRPDTSQYDQEVVTAQSVARRINSIGQVYSATATATDLDLLSEFQLVIKGEGSPNIYNGVIDPNFALAVNNKLTIAQAIKENQLVGSNRFSFGETADQGTYNLGNIRKLRKARVVPLGMELAAELVRDCNFRLTYDENGDGSPDYANFEDLTAGTPFGGRSAVVDRVNIMLQNCIYKPLVGSESVESVRSYNTARLTQVIHATLQDVVTGYGQAGSGICGDFDADESPFCNLVNPDWVLKLPPSQCFEVAKDVPEYGEILQNNKTGLRYTRCVNVASCLKDDGNGSCLNGDYGYCAKEQNTWQFNAATCSADFSTCTSYQVSGKAGISAYLKKTLSGSGICTPQNAGCGWYSTLQQNGVWQDLSSNTTETSCVAAGGTWESGHCATSRLYFNRFLENCDASKEGCNEFVLYKQPGNNIVPDNDFEYATDGTVPGSWDVIEKRVVASASACGGDYYESCQNYNFSDEGTCTANGGSWSGSCSTATIATESACTAAGATWTNTCSGAVNTLADASTCTQGGGTYARYCLESTLKHNLCDNPQFKGEADEQTACAQAGGQMVGSCSLTASGIATQEDCEGVNGTWSTTCSGAKLYDSTQSICASNGGTWKGYGPFSERVRIVRDGGAQNGLARLEVDPSGLAADRELQLRYTASYPDPTVLLTKSGDGVSAAVSVQADQPARITVSVVKQNQGGQSEVNSVNTVGGILWSRPDVSLITQRPGTSLQMIISIAGGQSSNRVYFDTTSLGFNSTAQIQSLALTAPTGSYESNPKVYYKKPPKELQCHGYDVDNVPPVLTYTSKAACEANNGFWDQPVGGALEVFKKGTRCYQYGPDNLACKKFAQVCAPEEVGCQFYNPTNGDPQIPAVIGLNDYCPAECVGYTSFKEEATQFTPSPDPLFSNFIASTARQCTIAETGCAEFTNLEPATGGGEQVAYYSYLRQCIKPGLGQGEKAFFTWQGRAQGAPQLITYTFKADEAGAPDVILPAGETDRDCRVSLGEDDLNCVKFYDTANNIYYRDLRRTISVSDDCTTFRKTVSNEQNCTATRGDWRDGACYYTVIPSEGVQCSAAAVGCTEFKGNFSNNVRTVLFDTFEDTATPTSGWLVNETGTSSVGLTASGEAVNLGGHSLLVPNGTTAIHKPVAIEQGASYTLSLWARTDKVTGDTLTARFSTARDDSNASTSEQFATLADKHLALTGTWKNFTVGPVYVSWTDTFNTQLIIGGIDEHIYIDNVQLKRINDSIFVIKGSWTTPASCDQEYSGLRQPGAMINCRAYTDGASQSVTLRSFTNICRSASVGCEALIDTKNSSNPYRQEFNAANSSLLDNASVPADSLTTLVLDPKFSCEQGSKACQQVGKAVYEGVNLSSYQPTYVKNDPDKYTGVPNAIMCSDEAVGCQELTNANGGKEYYKINETRLCTFDEQRGWVKKGAPTLGCSAIDASSSAACAQEGGAWISSGSICARTLRGVANESLCDTHGGTWITATSTCAADPYSVLSTEEEGYDGWVGQCAPEFNGCTEFTDVNPNYIFNGDFESFQPTTRIATNWTVENAQSGAQFANTSNARIGSQSLELKKTTERNTPTSVIQPTGAAPYTVKQSVARLEAGKTYALSFYYYAGDAQRGQGSLCPVPEATVETNYYDQAGTNLTKNPIASYIGKDKWVRVETLIKAPTGSCAGAASLTTETDCTAAGRVWTAYPSLQNHTVKFYAPQNGACVTQEPETSCAPYGRFENGRCYRYQDDAGKFIINKAQCEGALGGIWEGNCPDSSVLYDRVEVKPAAEDKYYVLDVGNNVDRTSCTKVDWDGGCIQFTNGATGKDDLIKVRRDRVCAAWLDCSEKYTEQDNYCADADGTKIAAAATQQACQSPRGTWIADISYCKDLDSRVNPNVSLSAQTNCGTKGNLWSTTLHDQAGGVSPVCVVSKALTSLSCAQPRGFWNDAIGKCSDPLYTTQAECSAPLGSWVEPKGICTDGSSESRATCEAPRGTWKFVAGSCKSVDLCTERSQGACVSWATDVQTGRGQQDDVRYDQDGNPLVVRRVSDYEEQTGYVYRFGTASLDRLTQWRSGDYSGYTIADRYPLEAPQAFSRYTTDTDPQRYTALACRIFPEETSPLPRELSRSAKFSKLPNLYAADDSRNSLRQLGNLCSYTQATASGNPYYFASGSVNTNNRICTQPADQAGKACTTDADCQGPDGAINGACQKISAVQDFIGNEGLCLESDTLTPLYETIYQDAGSCSGGTGKNKSECEQNNGIWKPLMDLQPYACLTYYPYSIDWDVLPQITKDGNYTDATAP